VRIDGKAAGVSARHIAFSETLAWRILMLADHYDLPVSIASAAARDAYVQGYDLALTLYPGAVEAFNCARATDPVSHWPMPAKPKSSCVKARSRRRRRP